MSITKRWAKIRKQPKDTQYLTTLPYDIECGRHSGFPDCCVRFFVIRWITKDTDSKFSKDYRAKLNRLKKHPGYIPCPKCLKNKTFVKVKKCPDNCKLRTLIWGKNWKVRKPWEKEID